VRTLALRLATLVAFLSATGSVAEVPSSTSVYSLVIAREQIRTRSPIPLDCGDGCLDSTYGASFDHLRTLAGPIIDEPLDALLVSHMPRRDVPALLVVETLPDKSRKVAFWAPDGSSRAQFRCIGGSAFRELAWHPAGPDIEMEGDAVCVDVSEIVKLPSSLSQITPIRALSPRVLRRRKH